MQTLYLIHGSYFPLSDMEIITVCGGGSATLKSQTRGPPILRWINIIPGRVSNHTLSKMCDEFTGLFTNFVGCMVEVWEWLSHFITYNIMDELIVRYVIKFQP